MQRSTCSLDPGLGADLREAVHRHREGERRRSFAARLHVGDLLGDAVDTEVDAAPDPGLCVEVASALLASARVDHEQPAAWLTRPGAPYPHDLDLLWFPPLQRAFAEAGVTPRCLVVVTKKGWYEPLGDERAEWKRLRIRT